jgi:hypothetical protein
LRVKPPFLVFWSLAGAAFEFVFKRIGLSAKDRENHMRYFKTSIPDTKLLLTTGHYVKWDKVSHDIGVQQTNDPTMAAQFDAAIDRQVGGVQEIDKPEYDELKKKQSAEPLRPRWREELGQNSVSRSAKRRLDASVAEDEKPKIEAVTVPHPYNNQPPRKIERPKSIKR